MMILTMKQVITTTTSMMCDSNALNLTGGMASELPDVPPPTSVSLLLSAGPLSTDMTDRMVAVWTAGVPVRIDWRAEGFESSSTRLAPVAV